MKRIFFDRYLKAARRLRRDEDGAVLIYVTVMLVAIIGLAGLALDASRYRSLQTQMQAGADALALAGARELDGSNGSITRATNAINNMISNTPEGMGTQSAISAATITFYSCLSPADPNATDPSCLGRPIGNVTTADASAKYVGVTVSPASIGPIFPIGYTSLSADAFAVAGYDFAVCNMPPVFICNPYETAGMDDGTATSTLNANLKLQSYNRQQWKLSVNGGSGYGPGHFGFLVPPDNCTGANCMKDWVATSRPNACYRKKTVDLNTGQMQSVFNYFNVRFDMYAGGVSTSYPPAANVRKGYQATNNNWCNASQASPYYTTSNTQSLSIVTSHGDTDNSGNANCKQSSNPCVVKNVPASDITLIKTMMAGGSPHIIGTGIPSGDIVTAACSNTTDAGCSGVPGIAPNSIVLKNPVTAKSTGVAITIGWPTSGLPIDTSFSSIGQGNGQWDCANYWAINHPGVALPAISDALGNPLVCGSPTSTTMSRFQVYGYENSHNLINDYSFPGLSRTGVDSTDSPLDAPAGAENGAPKCNGPGIATDAGGGDRRVIYAAVINCIAQSAAMNQGGATANNIPVAGFLKFFLTQPVDTGNQILYGEMTGAVGLDKNAKNNVQLYR